MEFEPNFSPKNKREEKDQHETVEEKIELLKDDPRIEDIESSDFPDNIKMNLLLTIADKKPAFYEPAIIDYSDSEEEIKKKRKMIESRKRKAINLLEKLKIPFEINKRKIVDDDNQVGEKHEIIGGKDEKSLEKLKEIHEDDDVDLEELGKIFGFPETAAQAYAKGQKHLMERKKAHKLLEEEEKGLSNFANFRLSKDNFKKEVKFLKKRRKIIEEISPKIYKEIIEKDENKI